MVTEETKTIQIGLRLDRELLKEIEILAENEGVDKMAWIKRSLANSVSRERDLITKEAIKDYINLILDEASLKEFAGFSKIPKDIEEARKENLNQIRKEGKNR